MKNFQQWNTHMQLPLHVHKHITVLQKTPAHKTIYQRTHNCRWGTHDVQIPQDWLRITHRVPINQNHNINNNKK